MIIKQKVSRDPFIGREKELELLHHYLEISIKENKTLVVFIRGDYGVGKTALVEKFIEEVLSKKQRLTIGKGKCAMETEESGLTPFIQILSEITGKNASKTIIREDLWNFLKKVAPAWLDIITFGLVTPTTTTIEEGKKLFKSPRKQFSQDNVFLQFSNAFQKLTEKYPALMFIDDLHWADQSSLRLLFHLTQHLKERGVMIIGTYRPVEALQTGANAPVFREIHANLLRWGMNEIEIEHGIDVATFLDRCYPNHNFSPELIQQIQRRTEGHALFLTQLLALWQDTGLITEHVNSRGQRVFNITFTPDVSEIPKSVGAILESRLALLSEHLRIILDCASVEGEEFTAQTIKQLLRLDQLQVYRDIETLEKIYYLVETKGEKEIGRIILDFYSFVHRFFREYIYGQISNAQKRLLHNEIGECLEKLYENPLPIAGQLARHFREAGEIEKAIHYLLLAIDFEKSRYMWSEAQSLCLMGLNHLEKIPPSVHTSILRFDLMEKRADSFYYAGNYEVAEKLYKETINFAEKIDARPEIVAKMYDRLADICDETGNIEDGMKYVQLGKDILLKHNIDSGESLVNLEIMESLLLGRQDKNKDAYKKIEQVIHNIDSMEKTETLEQLRGWAYHVEAIILSYLDKYSDAISAYKKALEIGDRIGELHLQGYVLCAMAEDYLPLGKLTESDNASKRGLEIAKRIGDISFEAYAHYCQGLVHNQSDNKRLAIEELERAIHLAKESSTEIYYYHSELALAYLGIANDKALEEARKGLAMASSKWAVGYASMILGQVEALNQNWQKAIEHFKTSLTHIKSDENLYYTAQIMREYGKTCLNMGDKEQAREYFSKAIHNLEKIALPYEIDKISSYLREL